MQHQNAAASLREVRMSRPEGRLLDLHAQAERPQVKFSFAEALLDLRA
jgi:hypothetical protein